MSITEAITERPLTRQAIQEFLTEKHLGFQPSDAEVDGAWTLAAYAINKGDLPTRDDIFGMCVGIAIDHAPLREEMSWTVETCRSRS